MKTDIPIEKLKKYLANQLNNFFPDGDFIDCLDEKYNIAFDKALDRLDYCFSHISVNGYSVTEGGGKRVFLSAYKL